LPADFIPPRVCILICEIILTLPCGASNTMHRHKDGSISHSSTCCLCSRTFDLLCCQIIVFFIATILCGRRYSVNIIFFREFIECFNKVSDKCRYFIVMLTTPESKQNCLIPQCTFRLSVPMLKIIGAIAICVKRPTVEAHIVGKPWNP